MKRYLTLGFGLFLLLPCPMSAYAEYRQKEFVIEEHSPIYKEVMPLAILWKDAILNKDFELLLKHVLPENYEYRKVDLRDKDSTLHRFLYDTAFVKQTDIKRKSVYDILKVAKKLKIMLIGREPISVFGVSAYYYDEAETKLRFPLSKEEEQRLWMIEYVQSGFIKINNEWKLSFELQFQDEPED